MEVCRIDVLLNERGFVKSREKAKHLILNGKVFVDDKQVIKPGAMVNKDSVIKICGESDEYVSRGAYKLQKAIQEFEISLKLKIAVDVGASTGGFTDFMLKNGCIKVYAVDVGHNQLSENLVTNQKVISLEKTNFRYVDTKIFTEPIDFVCIDVSFISLDLILPKVAEISNEKTDVVALVKPQFEVGKGKVGKNGIVRDKNLHIEVLKKIYHSCLSNGLNVKAICFSPIRGGNGNIEYLIHANKSVEHELEDVFCRIVTQTVEEAFKSFEKLESNYYPNM